VHRVRPEEQQHPQYSSATVDRMSETGSPIASWNLLRGRTRLGRDSDNHVVLDDERVSLHHALITVRDGVYWVEDLGSTNGTFVGDDKRVMEGHALVDGDQVRLGGVVLVFRGAVPTS
jgi:pSer/pThr/pTyr-binding forkhead associated (FHA) protein